MRFVPHQHLPLVLLVLLPPWAAWQGWGVLGNLLGLALVGLVRQVLLVASIKRRERKQDSELILETICISHYVEKVRWALDLTGIDYTEEQDAGIVGVFFTGRMVPGLRVPRRNFTLYNSSDILRWLYAKNIHDPVKERFFYPSKEALELEKMFDAMADHVRRFAYSQMMMEPSASQIMATTWGLYNRPVVPEWQIFLLKVCMPVLKPFMMKVLNLTPEAGRASLAKAREMFQETDRLLSDGRQFLLKTDKPTYIDVAFASQAAALAMPKLYGGAKAVNEDSRLSRAKLTRREVLEEVDRFKETPSGKFVQRMYQQYRLATLDKLETPE